MQAQIYQRGAWRLLLLLLLRPQCGRRTVTTRLKRTLHIVREVAEAVLLRRRYAVMKEAASGRR